ncbi:MAG TPA: putative toxin-antitoxin system toxin component, PIN family [Stellaceae bacterium]|nr:putative toxin-antitoxin system toxin component, PIN family [Stellaceae bacterium]
MRRDARGFLARSDLVADARVRVVLDTNVLLSALIRRHGAPGQMLEAWFEDRFVLLSHPLQLEEFRSVSRRPQIRRLIRPSEAGRLVNQIRDLAETVAGLRRVRRSDDPADDFLLAIAEAGRANFLVTGDKVGLLSLGRHADCQVLTARSFLNILGGR